MVNSMTGFASMTGQDATHSWVWEMRSVNGKGLDVRIRLPEGAETLEQTIKKTVARSCDRGTIHATLRTKSSAASQGAHLNSDALQKVVDAALKAKSVAEASGLETRPASPAELLAIRGVMDGDTDQAEQTAWVKAAGDQLEDLVAALASARAHEGQQLSDILDNQLLEFTGLLEAATKEADARKNDVAEKLRSKVEALLSDHANLDPGRLEQELALLAVKADVTEELDRLGAHISSAKELLTATKPIGRKFDFLMQEFNREANTLCSKSGSTELTRTGLDMKTLIDQMREQVQNIE